MMCGNYAIIAVRPLDLVGKRQEFSCVEGGEHDNNPHLRSIDFSLNIYRTFDIG